MPGTLSPIDPTISDDMKEYHENLIKQLDILVNQTFQYLTGKAAGGMLVNRMTTMMPPTVSGGNIISRMSNRYSKRSRTPSQMFNRDNRITSNNPQMGAGTGSTLLN